MRLTENTGRKKSPTIPHLGTIAQLCRAVSSQLRHVLTIRKKLVKQQYLLHMSHNMANFGPLMAEIGLPVWVPQQISMGFACWLCYGSNVAREANQILHDVWLSPVLLHYIYFSCPPDGILPCALYVQVLCSPLLHSTLAAGVSHTLRRGTRNGIMELSWKAPPIFD